MNPLRTTEKVHYIRVFTISEFIYNRVVGVHSKVYVNFVISGSSLYPGFIIVRYIYRQTQCLRYFVNGTCQVVEQSNICGHSVF